MEHDLTARPTRDSATKKIIEEAAQTYSRYFARKIDFFGLGIAQLLPRAVLPSECADSKFFVTFQVSGDEQGLCVVAFSQVPDSEDDKSMFQELANILASKFVTQLADANCCDIMISPPSTVLAGDQKQRYLTSLLLAAGPHDACVGRYEYSGSPGQPIRLAYLPSRNGGLT